MTIRFTLLAVLCIAAAWNGSVYGKTGRDGLIENEASPQYSDRSGAQNTLTAVNRGSQPDHEAEMIDPVPKGTEYVPGSAFGEGMTITYSIDGGKFYQPQPITYDFRKSDGAVEKRPALPGMYTHIKWLVNKPILPGTRVSASFRVKVID